MLVRGYGRSLLGMAIGAGICYCAYRLLFAQRRKKKQRDRVGASSSSAGEKVLGVSALRYLHETQAANKPGNVSTSVNDLQPHHIAKLLDILATNSDSSLQEKVLITLCNSAAFSVNHDIIRNLDGIHIIAKALSSSSEQTKVNALNALNNLSMNVQNQELIKDYIYQICSAISLSSLNSEVQLAGLRLIINMSVTDNYHNMVADHLPYLLHLLAEGNNNIQIHTLKVLVNLSANPAMTQPLLTTKVEGSQSLTCLFNSRINREILVRVLTFAANLSKHLGSGNGHDLHANYNEDCLFNLLFGDSAPLQNDIAALFQYPDVEVKEQVAILLINLARLRQM
ncbi:armadillo repeat-containing protein 10 isoform X2 [Xenopus laevis]|uniref:Armadillo repeat-containing domain-containing protein n=2 Tax=Xenopus laevis TaxID=8355 RepID=A0A974HT71_XENLA|nr:armadillo repeat-containing protein 10 isoform X2 [Xenopus laevis]OCT89163.1 hypothetical protein XELAEV_18017780mg [Xenopus laevis]